MARKRIGEILVEEGLLDAVGLRRALVEQRRWGGPLGTILVDLKLIPEQALVEALSRQLKFPTVDLDGYDVGSDVLDLVPGDLAERHRLIPFAVEGKFLDVAMSDPTNMGIIDELRIRTQLNVRTHLAGPKSIERALARLYGRSQYGVDVTFSPVDTSADDSAPEDDDEAATVARMERLAAGDLSEPLNANAISRAEVDALQMRLSALEALVSRDEDVIRKLLGLLVTKGVATREEILERIR